MESRIQGNRLIDFIREYKNILTLPEPRLKPVQISDIIKDVISLCENLESPVNTELNIISSHPI